jgi:hypothetical protein
MVPMELHMEDAEELDVLNGDKESRFYTCHVCGDNWLSIKETELDGDCQITFIHQMGMEPQLRRIAHVDTPVVINENTVDHWEYYVDDEVVAEDEWRDVLDQRRNILKSICTN